jgi:hypothetical protein
MKNNKIERTIVEIVIVGALLASMLIMQSIFLLKSVIQHMLNIVVLTGKLCLNFKHLKPI